LIEYRFAKLETEEQAIAQEALLQAYIVQHGELPPLNSNLPDRYGEKTHWLKS
jgi:hypothetical protein